MVQSVIPVPGRLKTIWALEQDLVSQPLYRGEMSFSEQKSKLMETSGNKTPRSKSHHGSQDSKSSA